MWFTKSRPKLIATEDKDAYTHEEYLEELTKDYGVEKDVVQDFGKTQVELHAENVYKELKNPASDVENVYKALTRANNSLFLQRAITDKLEAHVGECKDENRKLEAKMSHMNTHWKNQLVALEEGHLAELTRYDRQVAEFVDRFHEKMSQLDCLIEKQRLMTETPKSRIAQLELELKTRDNFIEMLLEKVRRLNIK
jgi:hypothetical protein